jgi:hypothetical protein
VVPCTALIEPMSATQYSRWDVTPIEIALDLAADPVGDPSQSSASGPAEPRVRLVSGFALTSHLKRIVSAVERTIPPRLPSRLRMTPAKSLSSPSATAAVTISPTVALLRFQSKLIRAIEPGLAHDGVPVSLRKLRGMDESTARFIGDFISRKALPSFEPSSRAADFCSIPLTTNGITIYELGRHGSPQWILAHWTCSRSGDRSVHLQSGP